MHRFHVARIEAGIARLSPEEAAHAYKVLRLRAGEVVELSDGARLFEAELTACEKGLVEARVTGTLSDRESPARITLYQGYPKSDKLEFIAQKLTELGAFALVPVVTERSVARPDRADAKSERLVKIASEAAKQCGRAGSLRISPAIAFDDAVPLFAAHEARALLWEDARDMRLRDLWAMKKEARDVALFVGPEGGISHREADALAGAGAACVTLGPRILRAETAAVCAVALAQEMWGDL